MTRRIVAVVVALLLAIVGTTAVFSYVKRSDARAVEAQEPVKVFIATKLIPKGTKAKDAIAKGLMEAQPIPRRALPTDAMSALLPSMTQHVASSDILAGEIVLSSRFVQELPKSDTVSIPKGMLAVSLELSDPARVADLLQVGSQIAVFDTYNLIDPTKPGIPAGDHITDDHGYTRETRVLLERVTVLAIGSKTNTATPTPTPSPSASADSSSSDNAQSAIVTVAVTQAEAEKLIHGIHTGTLYFALLSDTSKSDPGPGVNDLNLFSK
jgi:pilus assembly protein CpaB